MAKLVKNILVYDDGSETVITYQDNENAKEIEEVVAEAQIDTSDNTPSASPEVEELFASATENVETK